MLQSPFSALLLSRESFPCSYGRPPTVGFGFLKENGQPANVGLTFEGTGVSLGAMTNTFANVQNTCLGHQNAEQLAHWLSCSPAAGIVQLCEDLYRCGESTFKDGVTVGLVRVANATAHLSVFTEDMGEEYIKCAAKNLDRAAHDAHLFFPAPDESVNPLPDLGLVNAASQPTANSVSIVAIATAVTLGLVGGHRFLAAFR